MITGAIKNKIDKIWTDIWAGGITNPLTVIEQLTYLIRRYHSGLKPSLKIKNLEMPLTKIRC